MSLADAEVLALSTLKQVMEEKVRLRPAPALPPPLPPPPSPRPPPATPRGALRGPAAESPASGVRRRPRRQMGSAPRSARRPCAPRAPRMPPAATGVLAPHQRAAAAAPCFADQPLPTHTPAPPLFNPAPPPRHPVPAACQVTPTNVDIAKVAPSYHLYTTDEVEAVIGRL